ncbi:MAG: LUD domain-containing protein [Edaphocola sp.]
MSSRDNILQAVKNSQPEALQLPELPPFDIWFDDSEQKLVEVLTAIGGKVFKVGNAGAIPALLAAELPGAGRNVTTLPELFHWAEPANAQAEPHSLEDVDIAVLRGHFAVAENGAVWVTEECLQPRALPFICQRLVLVVDRKNIVPLMQQAYRLISLSDYGYAAFIAGPSKTADIEQSLVVGAHGPVSMCLVLVG